MLNQIIEPAHNTLAEFTIVAEGTQGIQMILFPNTTIFVIHGK